MILRISEPAKEDLMEIWEYIAPNNPQAAEKLLRTLQEKFEMLIEFPLIGRERHEIFINLRSFPVGKYLILYQSLEDILEIVRVRHSASNIKDLFNI